MYAIGQVHGTIGQSHTAVAEQQAASAHIGTDTVTNIASRALSTHDRARKALASKAQAEAGPTLLDTTQPLISSHMRDMILEETPQDGKPLSEYIVELAKEQSLNLDNIAQVTGHTKEHLVDELDVANGSKA